MVVSIKDSLKLFGISIMTCCAVTVCNMFINYYIDLMSIKDLIDNPASKAFFDAQKMTATVVCSCAGGCLFATTVVMLFFYIKHYIDSHSKEIGILKALGYSDFRVARGFSVFGLSVFTGCVLGFAFSYILMPVFYNKQNEGDYMPDVPIRLHPALFIALVILPSLIFAAIAVFYACFKLNRPCINLLKEIENVKGKNRNGRDKETFVAEMRSSVLRSRKTLIFFIAFSSYCFSSMIQMSASMDELASEMMGLMILGIGIVLAFTTLYIAVTTVIRGNAKNIAMMRVFGYESGECKRAVLDGYRVSAYIGFALGSAYQYFLLKIMVEIVFADIEGVPEFNFDIPVFFVTLAVFIVVYEGIMAIYGRSMKAVDIKKIMSE